jgi:hypothetical protein
MKEPPASNFAWPHEQRRRDQRLQAAMRLLGDPVFMRPA